MPAHPNSMVRCAAAAHSPRAEPGARCARQLHALVTPQSHDRSSTEQSRTRPSMMRCANSQQPVMAAPSVEYLKGPLKARKLVPRPISKSSVQRPESRIWNVRAVMAKPLYKTGVNCRPKQRSRRASELYQGEGTLRAHAGGVGHGRFAARSGPIVAGFRPPPGWQRPGTWRDPSRRVKRG
jgi:hypothetical protein